MVILGIDPGLATLGFGVIDFQKNKMALIDYGTIDTAANAPLPERLNIIFDRMGEIIDRYKPEQIAFEELFFSKNIKTALVVGHARGVAMAASFKKTCELYEYTPLQVKQAVVGYGRAEKHQVQAMVKLLLNLKEIPKPDDAADAVAVAICHAQSINFKQSFRIQ